jgi:phage shock protein A
MGILDRLNTLIKSNINSAFSRAENPRMQYEQALEDMDDALKVAKNQVVSAIADEKRLTAEAERRREDIYRWETRAQAALRAGDENLAREALIQKRRSEDEERELRRTAAQHRALAEELKASCLQLETKVRDARARVPVVSAQSQIPQSPTPGSRNIAVQGVLDDQRHFETFDRQARTIDELDAQVSAMRELDDLNRDPALEDRFRALEKNDQGSGINDELEALKAKLSKR